MGYAFVPFLIVGVVLAYFKVPGAFWVMIVGLAVSAYVGWWISRK